MSIQLSFVRRIEQSRADSGYGETRRLSQRPGAQWTPTTKEPSLMASLGDQWVPTDSAGRVQGRKAGGWAGPRGSAATMFLLPRFMWQTARLRHVLGARCDPLIRC